MRRAARTDANQEAIVAALRAVGASVQLLSAVGKGCPDLLVGYQGRNWLMECKDGRKYACHRPLTDDQVGWLKDWRGQAVVVLGPQDAVDFIAARSCEQGSAVAGYQVEGGWPECHLVPWRVFVTSETMHAWGSEVSYEQRYVSVPTAIEVQAAEQKLREAMHELIIQRRRSA